MTSLRPRDKAALGVVAGVLVIVAFYFLALAPQRSKISSLNTQIESQRMALAKDQTDYQEGRAAEISLKVNRSQWKALGRAVPEAANIPGLLRLLQSKADASDVGIQAINLNGGSGVGAVAATTGPQPVPVSLTFTGTYQNLEALMRRLDGLVGRSNGTIHATGPLVTIGSVSLSGTPGKLNAGLSASIYQSSTTSSDTATTGVTP